MTRPLSYLVFLVAVGCSSSSGEKVSLGDASLDALAHKDSGKDAPGSTKDSSRPPPVDTGTVCPAVTCDLVGGAEANAALGTHVKNPTSISAMIDGGTKLACSYAEEGTDSGSLTPPVVAIQYQFPTDASAFAARRTMFPTAITVPALGDGAYFYVSNGEGVLSALVGCIAFDIAAVATQDQLVNLANEVVPELRAGI
jgi:hypothetical protein